MKIKKYLSLCLFTLCAPALLVQANEPKTPEALTAREWRLSVGGGFVVKKNNRPDNSYDKLDKKVILRFIPYIQGSYKRFSIAHQGINFRLVGNPFMNASIFVTRSGDKYLGPGMSPRKDSVFFGASAKFGKYGLTISRDISGRSKGYLSQINYSEFTMITEDLNLVSSLSLEWHDDQYADYYYGVRGGESSSSKIEYHPHNFFKPGLSLMPIYNLWENVSLVSAANVKFIPKEIRSSPTMNGKALELSMLFALNYRF